jgi:hypothetical protein
MKSAHDSNMQTIQPAKRGGRRIGAGRARTKALIDLTERGRKGSGGGCLLVEKPPSLDESARAAREEAIDWPLLNCFVSGVTLLATDTTMIFVSVIVTAAYLAGI